MSPAFILAIDQGTTSTRAVVYDEAGQCRGSAAKEFTQHFPQPGWVEHDAEEIWESVADVVPKALAAAKLSGTQLAAVGLTNQRETIVLWDRASSKPVARAIVWQDRRTTDFCRQHKAEEPWLFERTGLVLDPYFSATKLRWMLEQNPAWRAAAEAGKLACGNIDSWLLWKLTGGKVHATDYSNASRTLLLNLQSGAWDEELCRFFSVPTILLAHVRPSAGDFGHCAGLGFLPDALPIRGVAGDQQAALFGQAGFAAGDAKCTYGTGAFFLQHTGERLILSKHRLLTSRAAMIDSRPQYVLEGSIFVAGAAVQWLRDGLKFIDKSDAVEALAAGSDPAQPILLVPGFVGLGAPHWVPEARGVIFGLTRNTTGADLARAALEGVAMQVADLIDAAAKDTGQPVAALRADGGMARNAWFLQRQADFLGRPVLETAHSEATALGAAYLAGLKAGVWPNLDALRKLAQSGSRFEPRLPAEKRAARLEQWHRAVKAVIGFYAGST
jgi:glycerol kinase